MNETISKGGGELKKREEKRRREKKNHPTLVISPYDSCRANHQTNRAYTAYTRHHRNHNSTLIVEKIPSSGAQPQEFLFLPPLSLRAIPSRTKGSVGNLFSTNTQWRAAVTFILDPAPSTTCGTRAAIRAVQCLRALLVSGGAICVGW